MTSNCFLCACPGAKGPGAVPGAEVNLRSPRLEAVFFSQAPGNFSACSLLQADYLQACFVLEENGQLIPFLSQTPASCKCAKDFASSPASCSFEVLYPPSHLSLKDVLRAICQWVCKILPAWHPLTMSGPVHTGDALLAPSGPFQRGQGALCLTKTEPSLLSTCQSSSLDAAPALSCNTPALPRPE